ncbi:MAG TPA: 50S ribosomal protein L2 [Verrucomicrobiales bacterium]|jgi:large subunit ribosomal protein L2|nr:50S ribosomal protein L2 [Verrucomicrobiales bacterium]HBU59437.1 50S ribosomal protein L2 [Verrucomicrobiales bacterium]|tara:strand:- start:6839 stop:7708 length:870 start_codon:yes stop_codon:yes gene_type:complete
MPIRSYKPVTPSQRYIKRSTFEEVTKTKPEKALVKIKKKTGGRNSDGHITMRGLGGGAKQKIRNVDFRRRFARDKYGSNATVEGKVAAIEYDPIRSARIALVEYVGSEKRYILAAKGMEVGAKIYSGPDAEPEPGNALPLSNIPPGTPIHNIELTKGKGGQIVRSAGTSATVMATDKDYAQIKLPSGEIRRVNAACWATVGVVGNADHEKQVIGKAGNTRHRGRRGITRAVAKNPVDHPMGGGEAKSSGGGHPVTPWGVITKGKKTRSKKKYSNKFILVRRDGRPMKRK